VWCLEIIIIIIIIESFVLEFAYLTKISILNFCTCSLDLSSSSVSIPLDQNFSTEEENYIPGTGLDKKE